MKPVPKITKDAPLKIEQSPQKNEEWAAKRRGRFIFITGITLFVLMLLTTWTVFFQWIKS